MKALLNFNIISAVFIFLSQLVFCSSASAVEVPENIRENDNLWLNFNLYHATDLRAGPTKFEDQYIEIDFGGRSGFLDFYGYVDFLDVFNNSESGAHDGANMFADIEPRFSLDYIFNKDLSIGPVREWYLAFDIYYADNECAQTCVKKAESGIPFLTNSSGLKVIWAGIGTDMDLPWLGKTGVNFYARHIRENYGASNEDSWDGYVFHVNWFKPFYYVTSNNFFAFQGYYEIEFDSDIDEGTIFEQQYRTNSWYSSLLGIWYHMLDDHLKVGYGLKIYNNSGHWADSKELGEIKTDSTGVAHLFNVSYTF